MAESKMNASLKRIAQAIFAKYESKGASPAWGGKEHALAMAIRAREVLWEAKPTSFKGTPAEWQKAKFKALVSTFDDSGWLYASNAKKQLVAAKLIAEVPEADEDDTVDEFAADVLKGADSEAGE